MDSDEDFFDVDTAAISGTTGVTGPAGHMGATGAFGSRPSRALWYYGGPTSVSDPTWHGNGARTVMLSNSGSPAIYASAASLLNK